MEDDKEVKKLEEQDQFLREVQEAELLPLSSLISLNLNDLFLSRHLRKITGEKQNSFLFSACVDRMRRTTVVWTMLLTTFVSSVI